MFGEWYWEDNEVPRHDLRLGPNLQIVLEQAPTQMSRDLFERPRVGGDSIVTFDDCPSDSGREELIRHVSEQGAEIRGQLEVICRQVIDLSGEKGETSLRTIVERTLSSTEIDVYEQQEDALCRSIWVYIHHQDAFRDAQSFHTARRHREIPKLYSAFEVATEGDTSFSASDIDLMALSDRMGVALDQHVRTRSTAIDLPATASYPKSVLVAIRHGGVLSSVLDHRDDGLQEPYYYRPGNEAVLIYTPELRKLEVCAKGYLVRERTSNTFAADVLGQDLSKKPLTNRNFNLDRFRDSLTLPLPDYDDVEVTSVKVTELETRLGNWKRRLLLQVTADDDIEDFADRYMGRATAAAKRFGYSRVTIVVGYRDLESGDERSFKLWVSSSNTSNAQNKRDPFIRDLGQRLLEDWALMENQRLLSEAERSTYFDSLLWLYDHDDDEVSGAALKTAGIDIARLQSGQIIEKKGRQDVVLIEEDGEVLEGDIVSGRTPSVSTLSGPFGEDLGLRPQEDWKRFRVRRGYLAEILIDAVKQALGAAHAGLISDRIAEFGKVPIGTEDVPTYFVRLPDDMAKVVNLDLEFRRRHTAGPGLILTAGDTEIQYLGSNVVVSLLAVLLEVDTGLSIDADALEHAYRAGQALVLGSDAPQVVLHKPRHATLHIPGMPPFNLFAEKQVTLFQRLVEAACSGQIDVRTGDLMRGMGSKSPMQLFSRQQWTLLNNSYIRKGAPKTWRLCGAADLLSI